MNFWTVLLSMLALLGVGASSWWLTRPSTSWQAPLVAAAAPAAAAGAGPSWAPAARAHVLLRRAP
jgi:hypothetical protein